MNDLPDVLSSFDCGHCVLYADDTTISSFDKNIGALTSKLNLALSALMNWCRSNHLVINPTKTKFMVFKSAQRSLSTIPVIQLGIHSISAQSDVVFLGIHLDPCLTFCSHFNHLKQKTAFGIRELIKARPFFSRETLLALYFAFIHSHITYGIVSWGSTYACHL